MSRLRSLQGASAAALFLLFTGCPGGGPVTLSGAVEKGPFVLGSSVDVSPVDAEGNPTGELFSTQTTSDLGEFQVDFDYTGFTSLEGTGFYYNEVTGDLSGANLTLRAFYDVAQGGQQSAYINLVTHLAYNRVQRLMTDGGFPAGDELSGATAQAEQELVAALGIGPSAFDPGARGTAMNILGGDADANAYLFAVSAILVQAARTEAASDDELDATLQELLNNLALDLSDDGALQANHTALLVAAEQALDPDRVMALLAARLTELGSSAAVPDLNRIVDTDQDGVVNADDNCRMVPNPAQEPVDGLCFWRAVTYPLSTSGDEVYVFELATGDFDASGQDDILAYSSTDRVHLLLANPDGSLQEALVLPSYSVAGEPTSTMRAGDVMGSADLDLVLSAVGSLLALPGDGQGGFGAEVESGPHGTVALAGLADFDGDGHLDACVVDEEQNVAQIGLQLGDGSGSFGAPTKFDLPSSGGPQASIADLDADGAPDVIAYRMNKGLVSAWLGDGAGGLAEASSFDPGLAANQIAVRDFDDDGHLDVLATDRMSGSTFTVSFGDGSGTFGAPQETTIGGTIGGAAAGDFDGDGKADAALTRFEDDTVDILLSLGTTFGAATTITTGDHPMHPVVGDFNGDGTEDLAVGNELSGAITVILMNP